MAAASRLLKAMIVRNHRQLLGRRIMVDQVFDQVIGLLLVNSKTNVDSLIFLFLLSAGRRTGGIEDDGGVRSLGA